MPSQPCRVQDIPAETSPCHPSPGDMCWHGDIKPNNWSNPR